jgi:hypothetical protein
MKHTNHTAGYFYLIYEKEYNFSLLTTTSTLLCLYLTQSTVVHLIYKLHSIIVQTPVYTVQLKVFKQLAGQMMVWNFITHCVISKKLK